MNSYEAKQEAKRARLERAADNANAEASEAFDRARAATAGIPLGQPILVDHHSAGRHRAALRKSDNAMRRGVEATKRAEELARRAEAVGTGGISSDDPDAVEKLDDKRTDLEKERDLMKACNRHYKKTGTLDGFEAPADFIENARSYLRFSGVPFPTFALSNIGARIRHAAKRVARIERVAEIAEAQGEAKTTTHPKGATVIEDPADNRVSVKFPSRLSRDDYKRVRSAGFVWSPTRDAFTRKYSTTAIYYANKLAELLPSTEG